MKDNYAEVLENYLIPAEEGLFDKLKSGLSKVEEWDRKHNPHKYKKLDEAKAKREKERKEAAEKRKAEEEKRYSRIYKLNFDANKALPNSTIVYPEGKFKDRNSLIDTMEKDLKIALRKILSSQEVTNAFNDLCKEYNNSPRGEEFDDRFRFDAPAKLSVNWLKSKFNIENFEEGDKYVYFEVGGNDQEFNIFIADNIIYALGDYIESMYANYITHVGHGDGDEGCLYIDFYM